MRDMFIGSLLTLMVLGGGYLLLNQEAEAGDSYTSVGGVKYKLMSSTHWGDGSGRAIEVFELNGDTCYLLKNKTGHPFSCVD